MNLDNFEKGQWIYLCCHNYGCYNSMVGKGGKAAVGGCMGVVIKRIPLFATCTGTNEGMNEMMGEMMMPCLSRTFVL